MMSLSFQIRLDKCTLMAKRKSSTVTLLFALEYVRRDSSEAVRGITVHTLAHFRCISMPVKWLMPVVWKSFV